MKWLCNLVGHQCRTVQSHELANYVGPRHWCWPGVVTFCPRCGMVYRNHYGPPLRGPFFPTWAPGEEPQYVVVKSVGDRGQILWAVHDRKRGLPPSNLDLTTIDEKTAILAEVALNALTQSKPDQ